MSLQRDGICRFLELFGQNRSAVWFSGKKSFAPKDSHVHGNFLDFILGHIEGVSSTVQTFLLNEWLSIYMYNITLTYQWWVESRTIYADWWVGILIGWWIRCTVNANASCWNARITGQCQSRWIILTWANRLSGHGIGHNWSSIFTTWLHWCGGCVRILRLRAWTYRTTWNTCYWSTSRTYRRSTASNKTIVLIFFGI